MPTKELGTGGTSPTAEGELASGSPTNGQGSISNGLDTTNEEDGGTSTSSTSTTQSTSVEASHSGSRTNDVDSEDNTDIGDTDITDPEFPGELPACDGDFSGQSGGEIHWQAIDIPVDGLRSTKADGVAAAADGFLHVGHSLAFDSGTTRRIVTTFNAQGQRVAEFDIVGNPSPNRRLASLANGDIALTMTGWLADADPQDLSKAGIVTRRYTREGDILWEHLFQITPNDADSWSTDIEVDADDNIYVLGQGSVTGGGTGADPVYFILDPQGTELSRTHYVPPGEARDELTANLAVDGQKRVRLTDTTHNLYSFDADGIFQSRRFAQGLSRVAVWPEGSTVLAGYLAVNLNPDGPHDSGRLEVLDANLQTRWSYSDVRPQGSRVSQIHVVKVDHEGDILVASRLKDCKGQREQSLYVAKYTQAGQRKWARNVDCGPSGTPSCTVYDGDIAANGMFYVVGSGGTHPADPYSFVVAFKP